MIVASTARLTLRTATLDDAPFYLALVNSPSFLRQLGDRGIRSLGQARTALADGPILMQACRGHSLYIVEHAGQAVGMCGLIKRDELDDIDLGYAFLPESQGRGFAREAGEAVLEYANRQLGIRRVLAIVSPENKKSISLLQKLGFKFVRMVFLRATDTGTLLYEHGSDSKASTPNGGPR